MLLIFHIRRARAKARLLAIAEAAAVLADCGAEVQAGGPLSEQGGVFWLTIAVDGLERAQSRFPRLGYSEKVETLDPIPESIYQSKNPDHLRWKKATYQRVILYHENADDLRAAAPDRRTFMLATGGTVREVIGYRGDGTVLGRRGLPVIDARVVVNLVVPPEGGVLLDPFAGVGGIVLEGMTSGCRVLSADRDPALRYGLSAVGSAHVVADAVHLPYADGTVDAIATEPPYEPSVIGVVCSALGEMARVVKVGGKIALLCAEHQADALRAEAIELPLSTVIDDGLDRKGTACVVLVWRKIAEVQ